MGGRIGEIVREKKYQARAFVILPMCFNVGVIIGPILGGILSDPAGSYPDTFGNVQFFRKFPYATPNIVSAVFLTCSLTLVWLFLHEVCIDVQMWCSAAYPYVLVPALTKFHSIDCRLTNSRRIDGTTGYYWDARSRTSGGRSARGIQ